MTAHANAQSGSVVSSAPGRQGNLLSVEIEREITLGIQAREIRVTFLVISEVGGISWRLSSFAATPRLLAILGISRRTHFPEKGEQGLVRGA